MLIPPIYNHRSTVLVGINAQTRQISMRRQCVINQNETPPCITAQRKGNSLQHQLLKPVKPQQHARASDRARTC